MVNLLIKELITLPQSLWNLVPFIFTASRQNSFCQVRKFAALSFWITGKITWTLLYSRYFVTGSEKGFRLTCEDQMWLHIALYYFLLNFSYDISNVHCNYYNPVIRYVYFTEYLVWNLYICVSCHCFIFQLTHFNLLQLWEPPTVLNRRSRLPRCWTQNLGGTSARHTFLLLTVIRVKSHINIYSSNRTRAWPILQVLANQCS
jgi:hypothetical protein